MTFCEELGVCLSVILRLFMENEFVEKFSLCFEIDDQKIFLSRSLGSFNSHLNHLFIEFYVILLYFLFCIGSDIEVLFLKLETPVGCCSQIKPIIPYLLRHKLSQAIHPPSMTSYQKFRPVINNLLQIIKLICLIFSKETQKFCYIFKIFL